MAYGVELMIECMYSLPLNPILCYMMAIAEGTNKSFILADMMVWIRKYQVVSSVLAFLWILDIISRGKLIRITILTEILNLLWRTMKNLHGVDYRV